MVSLDKLLNHTNAYLAGLVRTIGSDIESSSEIKCPYGKPRGCYACREECVYEKEKSVKNGIEPKFLGKEKIEQNKEIAIPRAANYMRCKSGHVKFFSLESISLESIESMTDAFTKIPENAQAIAFPEYRECNKHIHYGSPKFIAKEI